MSLMTVLLEEQNVTKKVTEEQITIKDTNGVMTISAGLAIDGWP